MGKVEAVSQCVDGVIFNSRNNIEAGLLEAEAETTCSRK
jgi:hypothetical protein